jgi:hypothetical protein
VAQGAGGYQEVSARPPDRTFIIVSRGGARSSSRGETRDEKGRGAWEHPDALPTLEGHFDKVAPAGHGKCAGTTTGSSVVPAR